MDKADKSSSKFVNLYGDKALDGGGFTMIPNDFLDNLNDPELTSSDKLVAIGILRLNGMKCSARKLGKRLGLSVGQVRASARKLDKKSLIERQVEEPGDVNQFFTQGITNLVRVYAEIRHGGTTKQKSDIFKNEEGYMQKTDSNKDTKDLTKISDGVAVSAESPGYAKAKSIAEELKRKH